MLMPLGIVAEIVLAAPPIFVLVGAISMVVAMAWLGSLGAQECGQNRHDRNGAARFRAGRSRSELICWGPVGRQVKQTIFECRVQENSLRHFVAVARSAKD